MGFGVDYGGCLCLVWQSVCGAIKADPRRPSSPVAQALGRRLAGATGLHLVAALFATLCEDHFAPSDYDRRLFLRDLLHARDPSRMSCSSRRNKMHVKDKDRPYIQDNRLRLRCVVSCGSTRWLTRTARLSQQ
ncbi:hypothetical protein BDV93DRAFT_327865 [Ceratobasidium sp. AG-I]|nr:hypothetical protein BDV93DRAFT_327865 [Ceratobasidium sp. AG-I]